MRRKRTEETVEQTVGRTVEQAMEETVGKTTEETAERRTEEAVTPAKPQGQASSPGGQAANPGGQTSSPGGQAAERPAEASRPQGQMAEPPGGKTARRGKTPGRLRRSVGARAGAFVLLVLMMAITTFSAVGAVVMIDEGLYTTSQEEYREQSLRNLSRRIASSVLTYLADGDEAAAEASYAYKNVEGVTVTWRGRTPRVWSRGTVQESDEVKAYRSTWNLSWDGLVQPAYSGEESGEPVEVVVYVPRELTAQDEFYLMERMVSAAYQLRYAIYPIGVAALAAAIVLFVFLLSAAGYAAGTDTPRPGWGTWVPADLLTAAAAAVCVGGVLQMSNGGYSWVEAVLLWIFAPVLLLSVVVGWAMSMSLRIKLGKWWENTLLYRAAGLLGHLLRWIGKGLRHLSRGLSRIFGRLPLIPKTGLFCLVLTLVDIIFLWVGVGWWSPIVIVDYWVVRKLLLIPLALAAAQMLRTLQKGAEALADGDLSYQVDTAHMVLDLKRHGENLNRIGEGMTAAVEQRMRSERMKTELITNVSHDIKTPLTSIINYSDLIGKEPCDNPTIGEYAQVLHRQSERLKHLIEDLVEASKASTGNLEVVMAPCEVGVMMTQASGEYQQRMAQRQLELVVKKPEKTVRIQADGRRLWRVFDNLMNNICHYGQPGTRVYLTLEEQGGAAVIAFKNTSREPLNLTAEELMERFVREDSSRKSEGNGLGLSIAKSLVELQNGTMEVSVDGDLFKVVLRFPILK